jgi:hypothetical protein
MTLKQCCYETIKAVEANGFSHSRAFAYAAKKYGLTKKQLQQLFHPDTRNEAAYDVNHKMFTSGRVHPDVWAK